MKTKSVLLLALLSIFLTACLPTPYQRLNLNQGYDEIQLDSNVFKVIFKGNRLTELDRTFDFVLLRCAEITVKNGFNYFSPKENSQYTEIENLNIYKPRSVKIISCYKKKPTQFSYNAKYIIKSIKKKYKISVLYNKMNGIH